MNINLACFEKPSRYIGSEVNIIRKDSVRESGKGFPSDGVKVALCFPDTYEVGMSHLGLKILYSIINKIPYAYAERVFAPWIDFESHLRKNELPLTSLEYKRPLKDFDIVGFTLQYELSYTNVLNMLDLGRIPIRRCDRGDDYPLIIAGGPCAVNPLPLTPFIDAFVIGDGEDVIGEIIEVYKNFKFQISNFKFQNEKPKIKENLFKELAKLEGIYVPSIHDTNKDKIKRRIIADLDSAPFPDAPVVPYAQIVHDRVVVEISRGCTKGCRFCQAGMIYRPLRERSPEKVLSISSKSILTTGYDEISFSSLSTGDYTCLYPLIKNFNSLNHDKHIAISLPSLRIGSVSRDVLEEIKKVRKTGFTIAPEAGTQRLRSVINKDFTDKEYEETLKKLFTEGWKNIKLYFMVGLPTETRTDIDGIINMVETASGIGRKITGRHVNINVGISAFVPKPHTPFQWIGQAPFEELREKQDFLRRAFRKRGFNFKGQHVELSLLEAVFSRGSSECAALLEKAWKAGCRFDGWSECFDFTKWLRASEKTGINLFDYASRHLDLEAELPWEFIETGITKKSLNFEYQKALKGEMTPDCRDMCYGCGLKCKDRIENTECRIQTRDHGAENPPESPHTPLWKRGAGEDFKEGMGGFKVRVKFSKISELRCLSHHELMTVILRAVRRAGVPVIYTAGFHPHPKISFGPALPVGIEGINEYFDMEIRPLMNSSEVKKRLNSKLPSGIKIIDVSIIDKEECSLNEFISCYEYEITIDEPLIKAVDSFMNLRCCLVSRDKKNVDIRAMVKKAEIQDKTLKLTLTDMDNTRVRLYEVLQKLFGRSDEEIQMLSIKRTNIYGYNTERWFEPMKREKVWLVK